MLPCGFNELCDYLSTQVRAWIYLYFRKTLLIQAPGTGFCTKAVNRVQEAGKFVLVQKEKDTKMKSNTVNDFKAFECVHYYINAIYYPQEIRTPITFKFEVWS